VLAPVLELGGHDAALGGHELLGHAGQRVPQPRDLEREQPRQVVRAAHGRVDRGVGVGEPVEPEARLEVPHPGAPVGARLEPQVLGEVRGAPRGVRLGGEPPTDDGGDRDHPRLGPSDDVDEQPGRQAELGQIEVPCRRGE
jgi:hypothetical protein